MMRYLLILCSFVFLNRSLYAHEVNEAFFTVKKQGNTIVVEAEFPWTMRDALIAFDPALKDATDKQDFKNTLDRYLRENLILIDSDGHKLPLIGFRELDKKGHSHQNNFALVFRGNSVTEITNTIMFDMYDNQVNYTTVQLYNERNTYETNNGRPTAKVHKNATGTRIYYSAFLLLSVIVISIILVRK